MVKLADLGFRKGEIAETVVSTYNTDEKPNAAPIGVTINNSKQVALKLYTTSATYKNIATKKSAVINVTDNIEIFYRTAFKEFNPNGKVPKEWFQPAEKIEAPKLRNADATIEVSVLNITPIEEEQAMVLCKVIHINTTKKPPHVYCRAFGLTLEAIIHATRVKKFLSGTSDQKKQANKLLQTIEECSSIVKRVAPNSPYTKIMTNLDHMINGWRKENENLH
ncbi:MAG: DUF447 family protein [Candidatus Bathyarchaeota archaeon]|nr:DUF447 family protein [Candidatus Bathyarchaeota archaeon]